MKINDSNQICFYVFGVICDMLQIVKESAGITLTLSQIRDVLDISNEII